MGCGSFFYPFRLLLHKLEQSRKKLKENFLNKFDLRLVLMPDKCYIISPDAEDLNVPLIF